MLKDKKRQKVSARRFCKEFAELWSERVSQYGDAILQAYPNNRNWTAYMLKNETSLLGELSTRLELTMANGWYTLDAVYYQKCLSLQTRPRRKYVFPACMNVIIEHENGERVETEMWKLLMFRSPLKVLMFYDKTTDGNNWLRDKLKELLEMCRQVDAMWPEAGNTEYLFLVGNQADAGAMPFWRFIRSPSGEGSLRNWPMDIKLKTLC